jgi:hypothetical protein
MIGMAAFPAFQLPPQDPDGRHFGISVLEQLEQFRKRLIRSAVAILVGMLVAFTFIERIVSFVLSPARSMLPAGSRLIYTEPIDAFSLYIDIALLAGVVLASRSSLSVLAAHCASALLAPEEVRDRSWRSRRRAVAGAAFRLHRVPYDRVFGASAPPTSRSCPGVETAADLRKMVLNDQVAPILRRIFLPRWGS